MPLVRARREHRLTEALDRFAHVEDVEVVYRSFQLDEHARVGVTDSVRDMLREKKGLSGPQVDSMVGQIERLAESEGLRSYRVLDHRVGNTSLAHEAAALGGRAGM